MQKKVEYINSLKEKKHEAPKKYLKANEKIEQSELKFNKHDD